MGTRPAGAGSGLVEIVNPGGQLSSHGHWRASTGSTLALAQCASATTGEVLAVFPNVVYLRTEAGVVLALSGRTIPLGPLSISLEMPSTAFREWLPPNARVRLQPGRIILDNTVVSLEGSTPWDPCLPAEAFAGASVDMPRSLEVLRETLHHAAPRGSLAFLLEGDESPMASETEALVLRRAALAAPPILAGLASAVATGDHESFRIAAASLAGLGGGFTPAGDDFLMGMALAVWVSLPRGRARSLARAIAEAAAPRTATVSAAYLRAAAQGVASVPWHELVQAVLDDDMPGVRSRVEMLCTVGHTSGADSLAGFVSALQTLPVASPTV